MDGVAVAFAGLLIVCNTWAIWCIRRSEQIKAFEKELREWR